MFNISNSEKRSLAGGAALFCILLALVFAYQAATQPLPILRQSNILATIALGGAGIGLLWIRKEHFAE